MRIGPLGIWELLIILVVVLLIFGPRRLPEMAKGLGQSVREFRKGIREMKGDFEDAADEGERTTKSAQSSRDSAAAPSAGSGAATSEPSSEPANATAPGEAERARTSNAQDRAGEPTERNAEADEAETERRDVNA